MSTRRRRSLIGRSPTLDRAPDRSQSPDSDDEALDDETSDSDEVSEDEESSDDEESSEDAPSNDDASDQDDWPHGAEAPDIAPPMLLEDAMPAPERSRDLAGVEKAEVSTDELFDKKVETANPAPQRTESGDAFPKDFEEEDDWFMKTGAPAPARVEEAQPSGPPRVVESNPWPMVIGLLVVAGLVGLVGVVLVFMS